MTIIKYGNRKLYTNGKYITMGDVYTLVKAGVLVKVIDYITKLDITKDTLKQALLNKGNLSQDTLIKLIKESSP